MKTGARSRIDAARSDRAKSGGIHYTPPELAAFLADRTLSRARQDRPISLLDPACGEGSLLIAAVEAARRHSIRGLKLYGFDQDAEALAQARQSLEALGHGDAVLVEEDFLQTRAAVSQSEIWPSDAGSSTSLPDLFDCIIANPPYVRTQVLGKEQSRSLARAFGLTGRVDLYHAFIGAMTARLGEAGVLGLLTSNRFLSTLSGAAVRRLLWNQYALLELFDLGDTKLFSASVLPTILIARRRSYVDHQTCSFTRIYEASGPQPDDEEIPRVQSPIEALSLDHERVQNGKVGLEIQRGMLRPLRGPSDVWILSNPDLDSWLATVADNTEAEFSNLAPIRVGIKSTADRVFVRDDWGDLPANIRPEPELLRPLLTHEQASKWQACSGPRAKVVLYPHEISADGRRNVVDLDNFPRAAAYLEQHREQLEGRDYVLQAGRAWYELWVPQNPADWPGPKVVFPDISSEPRFFLDETGAVVNGDCYWMPLGGSFDRETALLLLAVANSPLAIRYYDAVCGNRLYSGRRRFISQYVGRFPLPKPSPASRQLVPLVEELLDALPQESDVSEIEGRINELVEVSFGVGEESIR